ncbi:hypothetical protein CQW23_22463 [Capsicum baccatum]|uniref:Uncharacterized protein n=1 Tax=Capsicum baccatum TaxID=33114 RepID=A0A2G2W0Y0_CAPBA|nr:hypothetical protein CQW23_22463 [Capsicum baccatum]
MSNVSWLVSGNHIVPYTHLSTDEYRNTPNFTAGGFMVRTVDGDCRGERGEERVRGYAGVWGKWNQDFTGGLGFGVGLRGVWRWVSSDFMGEWVETSKCWKWRSLTKVTILILVRRNSSYDEFVASVMQSGDLDCMPSDVVISNLMYSREKVNSTIIYSDVRVLTYIMDDDADGFKTILRINVVERSFEGLLNSSAPPPRPPTVDDDLIDDDLNDYENGDDHLINMEDDSMHTEYIGLAR